MMEIEQDRVHRTLGPPQPDTTGSCEAQCHFHRYTRGYAKSLEKGNLDLEESMINHLEDFSECTLVMHGPLHSLLENICNAGATYQWGQPIYLIIWKDIAVFCLQHHSQLILEY